MKKTGLFIISLVALSVLFVLLYAQDDEEGKKIYARYCATCHGAELQGGMAQSLADGDWQFGSKRSHIVRNVKYGIGQRGMPAFEKILTEDQINAVLDFVESEAGKTQKTERKIEETVRTLDYEMQIETWVEGLDIPWAIDFPSANLALVTERSGQLRLIRNGVLQPDPVAGIPIVLAKGQGGLLDVTSDPDYPENGWIYLAYSHRLPENEDMAMTRIVRGRVKDNSWTDQQVLFEAKPEHYRNTRHHYGSRIVFDKKGYLYFSIGDRGAGEQAQDLNRPNGKVHRIHKDGRIPADNIYHGREDALATIFTYGNRNPQGLAVNPQTDMVWATEHGPMGGDELNLLTAGANYGWPVVTYGLDYDGTVISELTQKDGTVQPILYWKPSIAVCGLDFYRGDLFPRWKNKLIVGALKYEEVRILDIKENRVLHEEIILKNYGRVRDVASGPDGAIYVVLNDPGNILRLVPEK